ncbi:alanine/glycine:cation symporter family protein [Bremerella cremea]|uniref:alanine/glycine:cation symporter family protein n=1 Tax=Bremerella cremea TaxID=1031537 RepID=UPI0031EEDC66
MIATRRAFPWSIIALFFLVMSLTTVVLVGQDSQPAETAAEESKAETKPSGPAAYPPPVKLEDQEPVPLTQRVDNIFGWIVGKMQATLFYEVIPEKRQYAQESHVLYYVRPRGSKGPFVIAENSKLRKPADMPDEVSPTEAMAWAETGKVVGSANPDIPYRLGILQHTEADGEVESEDVQYLKYVINDSTKYVRIPGSKGEEATFRPVLKVRTALSTDPDDWKTPQQIREMAMGGELKLDFAANGDETPYLFTEYIGGVPLVVIWLSGGAVFFTFYFLFVNFWGVPHAINVVRGTYDDPAEPGEVTHFQALASALSATVGLGNIAGVTVAMTEGGPGAFFWMILCGFFGMTSKFIECTLGQMYREVKPDGTVQGGPMNYLVNAFEQFGLKPVGVIFSVVFSIMCVMASFGGGNMFQGNQAASQVLKMVPNSSAEQLSVVQTKLKESAAAEDLDSLPELMAERTRLQKEVDDFGTNFKVGFGLVMAVLVGLVIIGGIKRIGAAASKIVPTMCVMYMLACLYIILTNFTQIPDLVSMIFTEAFNPHAVRGGILGVIVLGVRRAAFSNEAGVGSAAIAHSAAKTDEPVREGFVALLEPFIDTIVVCSMTALVILITGAWDNHTWVYEKGYQGVELTSEAFQSQISWFPWVLTLAVVLFAFSTIISWSYYGERAWERLFGARSVVLYKIIFIVAVFLGPIFTMNNVLDFSDFMILSMAFPNIMGCLLLAPTVKRAVNDYWRKYKAGEFKKFH